MKRTSTRQRPDRQQKIKGICVCVRRQATKATLCACVRAWTQGFWKYGTIYAYTL